MPSDITVPAKKLYKILAAFSLIQPKGTNTLPIGIQLSEGKLTLCANQGCICCAEIYVTSEDVYTATFLYTDVMDLLRKEEGDILLSLDSYAVNMYGEYFECNFPLSYSVVEVPNYTSLSFFTVTSDLYKDNVKSLLTLNLEKLFSASHPVTVYQDVSVLKFPSVYVMIRTVGIPLNAMIDLQHLRQLSAFEPREVSTGISDSIVLRREEITLQLPCNYGIHPNNFTDFLSDMKVITSVILEDYRDCVRDAIKFKGHVTVSVSIYEHGIKTSVATENTKVSVKLGATGFQPDATFTYPPQVWLAILSVLGKGEIQILTGGNKICLRNQSIAILTSVVV